MQEPPHVPVWPDGHVNRTTLQVIGCNCPLLHPAAVQQASASIPGGRWLQVLWLDTVKAS